MSINKHASQYDLERSLDRDFGREPTYGADRAPVPLQETGTVRSIFADRKPTVVSASPQWRPTDEMAVAS